MIESPWNFNYLIRTIWFLNVAKWRISMFHSKITVLIYISTHGHQFSSIFRYVKSPFGACQSCYSSALVTLGFLAPSCKEPGLLEPPWGSGASSAAWGKAVLLLWGCNLQWELPGFFVSLHDRKYETHSAWWLCHPSETYDSVGTILPNIWKKKKIHVK